MYKTLLTVALLVAATTASAEPWKYSGSLNDAGAPANGRYDLRLTLLDANKAMSIGTPVTLYAVNVNEGAFTVDVDFGIDLANAPVMQLKTEVSKDNSGFVVLGEPTRFDPKAALAGICWDTEGNSGINPATNFVGTTDNQPLSLRASNLRIARFAANGSPASYGDAPSIAMGSAANVATGVGASVAGGGATRTSAGDLSPLGRNSALGNFASIGGGIGNSASGIVATIAGGDTNTATALGGSILGGRENNVSESYASIGGGILNTASGFYSVVAGGQSNLASAIHSNVNGGSSNSATGPESSVGGGESNIASGSGSIVSGGTSNTASGGVSTVGGGQANRAIAVRSTVGGGADNEASGTGSTVSGGRSNCAGGDFSWAGGSYSKIRPGNEASDGTCVANSGDTNGDEGTFLWADSQNASITSTGPNQFMVRAAGGVMFNTNSLPIPSGDDLVIGARSAGSGGDADADLTWQTRSAKTARVYLSDTNGGFSWQAFGLGAGANFFSMGNGASLSNGGTWTNASSRSLKHGFAAIDPLAMLGKLVALPITSWSYNGSLEGTHVGPVAEDFKAAFGLAGDGKSISTVDADGVALAAIQGLNQKLESENAALKARLNAQDARLRALEAKLK